MGLYSNDPTKVLRFESGWVPIGLYRWGLEDHSNIGYSPVESADFESYQLKGMDQL